jgi:hypothetical protein
MLVIRASKLGYPFRTIGKDGGDQTLVRPGIRQNGGLRVSDPSPIAGKGGYPSRRFFFSQRSGIVIRQACRNPSDSLVTLKVFVLSHVGAAKPLHTFARHTLAIDPGATCLREFRWRLTMTQRSHMKVSPLSRS